jgi:hypothetical protein
MRLQNESPAKIVVTKLLEHDSKRFGKFTGIKRTDMAGRRFGWLVV